MSEFKQKDQNEVGQQQHVPLLTITPFLSIMAVYLAVLSVWFVVFILEIIHFRKNKRKAESNCEMIHTNQIMQIQLRFFENQSTVLKKTMK